jgi:Adenylate and Guanylate cyclase catalytic domain
MIFSSKKRNRVVMNQAVESTEVVHTLYPAQVRDRLFLDKNNTNTSKKKSSELASAALAEEDMAGLDDDGIADSYDSTTIVSTGAGLFDWDLRLSASLRTNSYIVNFYFQLFADLAGFTAWSDGRPPKHVFRLLESL